MSVQHAHRRTRTLVYVGRFLAGRPMDGRHRTNSTFRYRADKDLSPHGRTSAWHHLPGWHRSAWRVGVSLFALSVIYGFTQDRQSTIYGLMGFTICLIGFLSWYTTHTIRQWKHHNHVVKPLYQMSTVITGATAVHGHSHSDSHKRYITVPRNYRDDKKTRIRLIVPPTWRVTRGSQSELVSLVSQKLGGDWDITPNLTTYPPYVEFYPSPAPPDSLLFGQIKDALDKGSVDKIIIGMGVHEKVISIDLNSDAPHIAISMGTGGGKSSLIRLIVAYLIHHGVERVDIIDPKRVSHNWARDIPGVFIYRTMAEQMDAIHNFRLRMESRYDALDTDENMTFPRHVLIIEEQNSWMSYAQTYWEDYRSELEPKDRGKVSRKNPAIADLAFILFQGRQACMNVVSIFQRMSASAAGGGDMRENYGAKILARYSAQTWKLLVGTTPVPRSSRINGRGRYVLGDEDHLVQFAFLTEREAQDYAMANMPADTPDPVTPDPDPDPEPLVSLREAVDAAVIPMRLPAAKRARSRAGRGFPAGIPTPVGTLYRPSDLRAWHAGRGKRGSLKTHGRQDLPHG